MFNFKEGVSVTKDRHGDEFVFQFPSKKDPRENNSIGPLPSDWAVRVWECLNCFVRIERPMPFMATLLSREERATHLLRRAQEIILPDLDSLPNSDTEIGDLAREVQAFLDDA